MNNQVNTKPQAFSLQVLTRRRKDGKLYGPMSPMAVANEMIQQNRIRPFHTMVRIRFSDPAINQKIIGWGVDRDYTAHDTLATISGPEHQRMICIFIDEGTRVCPVLIWFSDEAPVEYQATPIYQHREYQAKIQEATVVNLLTELLNVKSTGVPA